MYATGICNFVTTGIVENSNQFEIVINIGYYLGLLVTKDVDIMGVSDQKKVARPSAIGSPSKTECCDSG